MMNVEPKQEDDSYPGLETAMHELIQAIKSGDAKGAAAAYHSAFQICESYPHEESEDEGDE